MSLASRLAFVVLALHAILSAPTGIFAQEARPAVRLPVPSPRPYWYSPSLTCLTRNGSDVADPVGPGTASEPCTVTINPLNLPTLQSIAVTPVNPSIAKGLTQQFTATGTYSDSSTANLTGSVTWASATTSVATTPELITGGCG